MRAIREKSSSPSVADQSAAAANFAATAAPANGDVPVAKVRGYGWMRPHQVAPVYR